MVGVHLFRYKVHYETHIVFRLHEIKKTPRATGNATDGI